MKNRDPFEDEQHGDSTNITHRGSKLQKDDATRAGQEEAPQTFNERYEALLGCLTKEQLLGELARIRRELAKLKNGEEERQEAEAGLVLSKKTWLLLEQTLTDIVLIMDMGLRCTYCSRSFLRLTGHSADEMKLRPIAQVLTSSSFVTFALTLAKVLKAEQAEAREPWDRYTVNLEFERKGGPAGIPTEARITLLRDAHDQPENVVLIAHNPLAWGVREKALLEAKERYRILFRKAREPMYILSDCDTFIDVNDSWEAIFGYQREEVLGLRVEDVIGPAPGEFPRPCPGQKQEEVSFRATTRRKDGEEIVCLIVSTIWENSEGEMIGYLNIVREWWPSSRLPTAPKEIGGEMKVDQSESLALLSSMIAHEVKSPLAALLQGIEFIRGSVLENETLLDAMQRIEDTALRVIRVAERLVEFSDRSEPERQDADLRLVVEQTVSMLDDQIRRRGIEVRKRFAPDVPPVRVDVTQIEEVFANILMNAVEAVETQGIIEIILQKEKGKAWVRITFADNGPGIPAEDVPKVVAPFFTSKKATGGVGLGLTISKKIIEGHGGKVLIESRVGSGTNVIIRLPIT